ncbi:MAG: CDP-alcohol phosphatidyltransferase family protein [Polyangiales bacterium]
MAIDSVLRPGAHAALPSLLTLSGLLCGVAGVLAWPHPWAASLLLVSVALDAIDGRAARALNASTGYGARLDRAADTAIAYGLAWRVLPAGWDVAAVVSSRWSTRPARGRGDARDARALMHGDRTVQDGAPAALFRAVRGDAWSVRPCCSAWAWVSCSGGARMARVILGALVVLLAGLAARVSVPWAATPGAPSVPPAALDVGAVGARSARARRREAMGVRATRRAVPAPIAASRHR